MPSLADATAYAAAMHDGQTRHDGRTPYISHPLAVVAILREAGIHDDEVLQAAALHDVLEDTAARADDLMQRFGPRVHGIVAALTRPEGTDKLAYLAGFADAAPEAIAVKLADRLSNLRDSPRDLRKTVRESLVLVEACLRAGHGAWSRQIHALAGLVLGRCAELVPRLVPDS